MIFTDKSKVINHLYELTFEKVYVFRGISSDEQLFPHIVRHNLIKDEFSMLEKLENDANYLLGTNDYLGFVAHAQHFGLPTRLLDFTYNPFIALYFALYNSNSQGYYKIIYTYLDPFNYRAGLPKIVPNANDFLIKSQSEQFRNCVNYIEKVHSGMDQNYVPLTKLISQKHILFIKTLRSNQRVSMQQGLFMLPYTLDKKEHMEIMNSSVVKEIVIDKSIRMELLQFLETIGITSNRIMLDLGSICHSITKFYTEGRADNILEHFK